jgi:hypothetical protein
MKYTKPGIRSQLLVMDTVRHAQMKGLLTLLDCLFPALVFTTPMAYQGDE